jgi:hypothetical protein
MKSLLLIASICFSLNSYSSPLFESEEVLEINISSKFFYGDWPYKKKQYIKAKEYREGKLSYEIDGENFNHVIEIKARGGTRHTICQIPPYKLKIFQRDGTPFENYKKKIKLVTHCKDLEDSKIPNQKVISEYLAYKLISKIYPYFFKVKLVKVNYIDLKYGPVSKGYGILLEHKKDMAKRNKLSFPEGEYVDNLKEYISDEFPLDNYIQVTLANSMLNNWDWKPLINVLFLKNKEQEKVLVPYDFDRTGIAEDFERVQSKNEFYVDSQDYFNPSRFPQYVSINFLTKKNIEFDLKELKKLYLKHAEGFLSKKEQVISVLHQYRHLLEPKNFDLINERLTAFFTALNKPFEFYTREDYENHLTTGDIVAKANAIKFISDHPMDIDKDYNLIHPLFFKPENKPLKKLINEVILRNLSFGQENANNFLTLVSK